MSLLELFLQSVTISVYFSGELEQDIDTWILIGDPSRKHPSVHCKRYVAIYNTADSIFHGRRLRGESGEMSNLYTHRTTGCFDDRLLTMMTDTGFYVP